LKDFDKLKPFLENLGFKYKGSLQGRDINKYGSKIKIIIKDSPPILNPNIRPIIDDNI